MLSMHTYALTQTKPLVIDQNLVKKIVSIKPDSSNAKTVDTLLGAAASCLPQSAEPSESWMCQWKGDPGSNRLINTLNISFEAGMITTITAINAEGHFLMGRAGSTKIKIV